MIWDCVVHNHTSHYWAHWADYCTSMQCTLHTTGYTQPYFLNNNGHTGYTSIYQYTAHYRAPLILGKLPLSMHCNGTCHSTILDILNLTLHSVIVCLWSVADVNTCSSVLFTCCGILLQYFSHDNHIHPLRCLRSTVGRPITLAQCSSSCAAILW